jgi:hypothetical protein
LYIINSFNKDAFFRWRSKTRLLSRAFGRQKAGISKVNDIKWSKTEKKIAREAFEKAYERECSYFAGKIREKVNKIRKPEDIWKLHDFLEHKIRYRNYGVEYLV